MRKWLISLFILWLIGAEIASAQLCNGSLSDPIISIDFGNGPSTYGAALPSSQTTYSYLASNNLADGQYTITTSPHHGRPEWHNAQDHTANDNNGYMLLVNASNEPGEFYRTRVTDLCENTIFEFSAWAMNVLPPSICGNGIDPNLRFEIRATNGDLIAFSESGNITESSSPTWLNFGVTFDIGTNTEVDVVIINNAPGGCGNDLAIDDIEFRACGDDASITSNLGQIEPFCVGEVPSTLTLEAVLQGQVYQTPYFQWETSTDGTNWIVITGAINNTYTVSPLTQGTFYRYRAAGSSANITNPFCSVLSDAVEISLHPDFEWQISAETSICENNDLELLVTGNGGINQVDWLLPNNSTMQGNPLTLSADNVNVGEYKATVTDENGCKKTIAYELLTINEISTVSVDIQECEGTIVEIGAGENFTVTTTEIQNRTIPKLTNGCDSIITYNITAFDRYENVTIDTVACYQSTIIDPNGQLTTLTNDISLNYSFLSINGCDSLVTKNITVPQPVDVIEKVCENDVVNLPDGSQLTATTTFSQQYTIPSQQYPTCDSIINYTLDVGSESIENYYLTGCPYQPFYLPDENETKVEAAGIYPFRYTSQNGCDSTINYIVNFEVDSCSYEDLCRIRFPKAITPDGNQTNDSFKPLFASYCNYANYELSIFNRWGEKIYESGNPISIWQPADAQDQSVYLWHVRYSLILEDGTEKKVEETGKIMLLK